MPYHDTDYTPKSYINGKFWQDAIEKSLKHEKGDHWYAYLQLGVTAYIAGEVKKAEKAFLASVEKEPSLWAYRNLAMIYMSEYNDIEKGFSYLEKALTLPNAKSTYVFLKEVGKAFTENERDKEWIEIYQSLSEQLKNTGRLRLYFAFACVHCGDLERAKSIITSDFVLNDIREGESCITRLWQELYTEVCKKEYGVSKEKAEEISKEKYPLPYELDYRMHD